MNDERVPDEPALDIRNLELVDEVTSWLHEQSLDREDILFRGSAALAVRGLRQQGDVDIAVTTELYRNMDRNGLPDRVSLSPNSYRNITLDNEDIIYDERYHDEIDGYKVVRPEIYFARKHVLGRLKDQMDRVALQQYAETNPDDWNWELVKEVREVEPADSQTLVHRFLRELKNEGVSATTLATYRHIRSALSSAGSAIIPDTLQGLVTSAGTTRHLKSLYEETDLYVYVGDLLERCYESGEFTRYDIILQSMYLEDMLGGGSYGIRYEKATDVLGQDGLRSPKWGEGLSYRPAAVSRSISPTEPEGLARAIALDEDAVEISLDTFALDRFTGTYTREWLEGTFESEEIEEIETYCEETRRQYGLHYFVLVWPYALEHFEDIRSEIEAEFRLIAEEKLEVDDFNTFLRQIYTARKNRSNADIGIDIAAMEGQGGEIGVVEVETLGNGSVDRLTRIGDVVRETYRSSRGSEIQPPQLVFTTGGLQENRLVADVVTNAEASP